MPRLELTIPAVPERTGVNPFTRGPLVIPGRPGRVKFFEAEQQGLKVVLVSGGTDMPTKVRETTYPNEDEAYGVYARELTAHQRGGYVPAGPAREIPGIEVPRKGSSLLIDVYLAAEDPRFVEEVLAFDGAKKLAALAQPWFADARPFARQALLAYVKDGCDRPEHKALVKRLFKLAEAAGDRELLAYFMVAFDRLTRRALLAAGGHWDKAERLWVPTFALRSDPLVLDRLGKDGSAARFTRRTRRYLARRALRYFRRIGYTDKVGYRKAVLAALVLYRDEDLNTVGRLLCAWGLMHVLYGRSPVLGRAPQGITVQEGRSLSELTPAPLFSPAWDDAFEDVLGLLREAPSRTVRAWSLAMLRARYAEPLAKLPLASVKALVLANNEEAQVLGVELLGKLRALNEVPIADWLELLGAENLEVLAAVCDRAASAVNGAELSLAQCVELALSPAAPLAALGLFWAKDKPVTSEVDLRHILRLAGAKVASVRRDAAVYVARQLRALAFVRPEQVRDLCDAQFADVRGQGLLVATERFPQELALWSSLCESPYADVRSAVVSRAKDFRAAAPQSMAHLFGTVLLTLQGAAKDKRRVARELVLRVGAQPSEAEVLLPLLRTLLGSVQPVDRVLALTTLARTALQHESVRGLVAARFPELSMLPQVSE